MKSAFSKNFLVLLSGTAISQIIPFAAAFVISRIYTNEEFGFYGLFITIAGILSALASLKYESALFLSDTESHAIQIIQTVMFIAFVIVLFLFGVILLGICFFNLSAIYALLPISVLAITLYNTIDRYYNRFSQYKSMSAIRVYKSTSESAYNLLGIFEWLRSFNLVLGFVIGYAAGVIFFFISRFKLCCKIFSTFSFENVKQILKEYKNFAFYSFPHTMLNSISTSIPVLLIPIFYNDSILGLYMFGFKYVQAPLSLISGSICNVFGQELKDCFEDKNKRIQLFWGLTKKLLFIGIGMFPLLLLAPYFFEFCFGRAWILSGKYIQLLSFWIVMNFIISSLSIIPVLFQKQRQSLILEIVYSIVKVIPFIIFAGICHLTINHVLIVYMILTSFVLIYSFYWNKKLIYGPQ